MNKGIAAVIIIIVLIAGGYLLFNKQKNISNSTSNKVPTSVPKPTTGTGFTSIQDALAKSVSLKCDYPDPKDSSKKVSTYIKAGSVRVVTASTPANNVIVKDNKMYNWFEGQKNGTVIELDINTLQEAAGKMQATSAADSSQKPNQKDAMINQMEQYKEYCKQATIADTLFEVPKDIKFVDFSAQMKQSGFDSKEMMEKMQSQFQKSPPISPPSQ